MEKAISSEETGPVIERETLSFLESLWAEISKGYLIIWTKQDNKAYAFTRQQFPMAAEMASSKGKHSDVYFGLGLQEKKPSQGSRGNSDGVMAIFGFWLDVDFGEGHSAKDVPPTLEAALELISTFLLTPTIIINSGAGLHVYWLFKEPWDFIDAADRHKASRLSSRFQKFFMREAQGRGWQIDNTSDLARLLRVPGTFNHKHGAPRPVSIISWEETNRYEISEIEDLLPEEEEEGDGEDIEYQPANFDLILQQCGWVRHCQEDAAELSEPEWYALLSIAARCEDGEPLAHELSKPYPGYSEAETQRKINQALTRSNARTCRNIRDNGGEPYCEKCQHWGKIKSPITLGRKKLHPILELNERHAVVLIGGKCIILHETFNPVFKRQDVNFMTANDFKIYYGNRNVKVGVDAEGNPRYQKLGTAWLESIKRRQYKGLVFAPGQEPEGFYNLYKGFAIEPRQGDWSLYRNHIFELIANGNIEIFNYIIAWMADLIQCPGGERPGTAIVLRGGQGVGKGCFVSQFGRLLGQHFLHLYSHRQLTGRFNPHLKDVLLVFADEATWGGDKTAEGILKSMVTEDQLVIEPKGVDLFVVKNHIRLMVASNNDWVIPAGFDERRFCVLDIPDTHRGDGEYFKKIFDQMDNGGREALLYDLLNHDYSGVDLRTIPRTEALIDQVLRGADTVTKFWFDILEKGDTPDILYREAEGWGEIPCSELYSIYLAFAKNNGERYPGTNVQFSKKLRKLVPNLEQFRPRIDGDRVRYWRFPDLTECRRFLSERLDFPYEWPEIPTDEEPEDDPLF